MVENVDETPVAEDWTREIPASLVTSAMRMLLSVWRWFAQNR